VPTYEYKCEENAEHKYEEVRDINDSQKKTICAVDECGGKLARVFNAPPITFKGSGFSSTRG
jgi:hypothetical protein